MQPWRLVAHNTATASTNKIHDDDVARRYGFRGGLVPGVDVYAYLTHPPAERWGLDWLTRGTMRGRFASPVYDGEAIDVVPSGDGGLEVRDADGAVRATGAASLPPAPAAAPDVGEWPAVEQRRDPPPASPEVLVPGTALGLDAHRFHAGKASEYLDDVRETLPLYREEGVAHPGWVLRDANYVLSANVRLGPWIHVESVVQHHGLVRDSELVAARAVVTKEWERKGHRFVELDVLHLADDRAVARTTHTAIYRPRG